MNRFLLSLLVAAPLTACQPVGPASAIEAEPATFAELSDTELAVAFTTASGMSNTMAWMHVFMAEFELSAEMTDCASITDDGTTFTLEADSCTTSSGTTYSGRVTGTSFALLESDGDSLMPLHYHYEQFQIEDERRLVGFDGEVSVQIGEELVFQEALDVTYAEYSWTTDVTVVCTPEIEDCGFSEGSVAHIDEVGAFDIEGAYFIFADNGNLVLSGADSTEFDVELSAECVPYRIRDAAGDVVRSGELCGE